MRPKHEMCSQNNNQTRASIPSRRRRIDTGNLVCVSAAVLLSFSSPGSVGGFQLQHKSITLRCVQQRCPAESDPVFGRSSISLFSTSSSRKSGRNGNYNNKDRWSLGAEIEGGDGISNGSKSESRFGVRRRVKSVLQKARNRTGIRNYSEDSGILKTEQTALDVIADAASIGGLGGVLVDEEAGTVDVALDFVESYESDNSNTFISRSTSTSKVNGSASAKYADINKSSSSSMEVDALRADVSAAFSMPASPLPFSIPELSDEQTRQLEAGERVQFQSSMAREGSGYVVVDVKAPPYVVWECLLDFESYPETIPTVRDVTLLTNTHLESGYTAEKPIESDGTQLRHGGKPSVTRAVFTLSKFRLKIAAIHKYRPHPTGDYMIFTLDQNTKNAVLQHAKGVWHTQDNVREGFTRVWLLCELKVSSLLPRFIVDYAAKRAMPRATTWLKPQVEAATKLWLKDSLPPLN